MRDAIEIEWAGVPAVAIIARPMVASAEGMKALVSTRDYKYMTIEEPIGQFSPEDAQRVAAQVTPGIVRLVTAPAASAHPSEGDSANPRSEGSH